LRLSLPDIISISRQVRRALSRRARKTRDADLCKRYLIIVLLAEAATLPLGLLSLREVRRGGYRTPERFWRNTRLGVSAVMAVGVAEAIGFLIAGSAAPAGI